MIPMNATTAKTIKLVHDLQNTLDEEPPKMLFRAAKLFYHLARAYGIPDSVEPMWNYQSPVKKTPFCSLENIGDPQKAWNTLDEEAQILLQEQNGFPLAIPHWYFTQFCKMYNERFYERHSIDPPKLEYIDEETGENYGDELPEGRRCILTDKRTKKHPPQAEFTTGLTLTIRGKRVNCWREYADKYNTVILSAPSVVTEVVE